MEHLPLLSIGGDVSLKASFLSVITLLRTDVGLFSVKNVGTFKIYRRAHDCTFTSRGDPNEKI